MLGAGVGVGPGHVGLAQRVDHAARDVKGLDAGVALGKAAVGLGELRRTRHLHGGGHAERAVGGHAGQREVAGPLVKEDVHARERDEPVVAGGDEGQRLQLGGQAKAGAEVGVVKVAGRDLLKDATHGLGRLAQDAQLGAREDLGREGPGRGALAVCHGMGGGEVGGREPASLGVTVEVTEEVEVLVLELTTAKVAHDIPRFCSSGTRIVGVAGDKNKGRRRAGPVMWTFGGAGCGGCAAHRNRGRLRGGRNRAQKRARDTGRAACPATFQQDTVGEKDLEPPHFRIWSAFLGVFLARPYLGAIPARP